jgi:hypothetical protein
MIILSINSTARPIRLSCVKSASTNLNGEYRQETEWIEKKNGKTDFFLSADHKIGKRWKELKRVKNYVRTRHILAIKSIWRK